MSANPESVILLVHCPDAKGIVHKVTDFVLQNNGNIIKLDQHVDEQDMRFFMRIQWDLKDFVIPNDKIEDYFNILIAQKYMMNWSIHFSSYKPKAAIFVSKYAHCIYDILSRVESGEWQLDIPIIISNHEKFESLSTRHGIRFVYLPIINENKIEQELKTLSILDEEKIDFIILARYMQILSKLLIDKYPMKIINIHHSSLPAFAGANPYGAAYERGVKFMGATAHYVTERLDEGPIISQGLISLTHRDTIIDMKRKGKDIEKVVLANAIWSHFNYEVISYNNKTVVFD